MAERVSDQEFVEFIVKQLVDVPEAVVVNRKVDEMGVLITLDVDPQDMGMVIGRDGATAKALRTLLRVVGARENARVNMKINEPEGSERAQRFERADNRGDNHSDSHSDSKSDENKPSRKTLDEVVGDLSI